MISVIFINVVLSLLFIDLTLTTISQTTIYHNTAGAERFELPTPSFGDWRSAKLSYAPKHQMAVRTGLEPEIGRAHV